MKMRAHRKSICKLELYITILSTSSYCDVTLFAFMILIDLDLERHIKMAKELVQI